MRNKVYRGFTSDYGFIQKEGGFRVKGWERLEGSSKGLF